jgi:hypothetical protein
LVEISAASAAMKLPAGRTHRQSAVRLRSPWCRPWRREIPLTAYRESLPRLGQATAAAAVEFLLQAPVFTW